MAALIGQIRELISDNATLETFTDQQIQDALDAHQTRVRYLRLCDTLTLIPGGGVVYLEYIAEGYEYWEADVEIINNTYTPITPAEADFLRGWFRFDATPARPLLISGKVYDMYGAAADLLEKWASKFKLEFDWKEEGVEMKPSQRRQAIMGLAGEYRAKQKPRNIQMIRDDIC